MDLIREDLPAYVVQDYIDVLEAEALAARREQQAAARGRRP